MDQLFVEIEISTKNGSETEIFTSVQSFVALYVYRFLGSSAAGNVKLSFVRTTLPADGGKLKLRSETLRRELTEERILCKEAAAAQAAIRDLRLPVYAKSLTADAEDAGKNLKNNIDNDTIFIAGMCAVCRELVARQSCAERRKLLGFKAGCLLAPAEASIWTRYCELDIVEAINRLLHAQEHGVAIEEMPLEVARFEHHMNEPVRMHNIYKLAREQATEAAAADKVAAAAKVAVSPTSQQQQQRKGKPKSKKIIIESNSVRKEQLPIEHRFAEGIAFTIADLILYPCVRLIFQHCGGMLQHFPLTSTWLSEIDTFDPSCQHILSELHTPPPAAANAQQPTLKIPDCEPASLYKSDPKRYKPRNRIYTEQSQVDAALAKFNALQLHCSSDSETLYGQQTIDWSRIEPEHAASCALPPERLERKRQQLENLANAVVSLAAPGDRIVDFCSGTGHLGILLALQLPQCTVILMENKAISLERAKKRARDELKLTNVHFYQCNIDYFEGRFDLGTSLHACGTATDIVLQQCCRSRAKFVCCPCCYGSLQPMPHIRYPLSGVFRSALTERDYLYLAHTADQAHALGTLNCAEATTRQGQLCMDIVDTDRKLQAEEAGYTVILTRLQPEACTPKNRLLVGRMGGQTTAAPTTSIAS